MIIGIIVLALAFILMVATGVPLFGATALVFVGWLVLAVIAKLWIGIRNLFATPKAPPETAAPPARIQPHKPIRRESTKEAPAPKGVSSWQLAFWILLAFSVLWCARVFYQYRGGPYVTGSKVLVDCIPFAMLVTSAIGLLRLNAPVGKPEISGATQFNPQRSSSMTIEQHTEVHSSPLTCKQKATILAVIAAGIIFSTFLPWFHISGSASFSGGNINMSGITIIGVKGDGIVGLIVGVVSLVMALCRTKWSTIPGVINIVLGLMFLLGRNTGGLTNGTNTPGIGLVLFVLTTITFAGFSLMLWKKGNEAAVPEPLK